MKKVDLVLFTLLLATMALAQEQAVPDSQVIDRFIAREQLLVQNLHNFSPLVETYVQYMRPDAELGSVPEKDEYFLGRMKLSKAITEASYTEKQGRTKRVLGVFGGMFTVKFAPEGFDGLILVDGEHFDRAHYGFTFVRREFLGDIRTMVYDVKPAKGSKAGFLGRIWVEDQEYNIVRFNGTHEAPGMFKYNFHFDSWRQNVRPGLWLPTLVYNEESDMKYAMFRTLRFKSQTRLWGYDPKFAGYEDELTRIKVESKTGAQDHSQTAEEYSPLQSQRMFEGEAEQNVIERLERAGLIAPKGEVDKVLNTVVNNLEVTNNLDIEPEVQCRVLLTSPLESFTVGHTIVLSRGLIDTLPDEASLAAVLSRELAHIALGHRLNTKYAFSDRMLFSDPETLQKMRLRRAEHEEDEADTKAIAFLKASPYSAKLGNAGLFLRQLQARAGSLPNLTTPRLGNPLIHGNTVSMAGLAASAPELQMQRTEQVAALPLGARVKLDPWSSSIEMVKARPLPLLSAREKMPFEVTPLRPYLKRQVSEGESATAPENSPAPETAPATVSPAGAPGGSVSVPAAAQSSINMSPLLQVKRP
ncbi:MAG: M48 family metalloprotease [Acidobacteriia bacterium]|nr:M48 family metalloprotease [Terriglobia bacterium]